MRESLQRLTLAVVLLTTAIGARAAEAQALQLLEEMQGALARLAYRGEFSYYHDRQLSSLAITHARLDDVAHERIVHLDGPRREIVRRGDEVSCFMEPADPMLAHAERLPTGPFARAFVPGESASGDMLPERYSARIAGVARIAGQPAVRVDVVPDDGMRYGYRLWLHDPTALPLRAELHDEAGEALEIFQFVHIEIGVELGSDDFLPGPDSGLVRQDLALEQASETAAEGGHEWEAGWLPAGFEMAAATLRTTPARAAPVQTLRYSDGIASLSIFVERAWADDSWERTRRQGATSAVMRELESDAGERWLVTVVGEVPVATAERVAEAVRPRS